MMAKSAASTRRPPASPRRTAASNGRPATPARRPAGSARRLPLAFIGLYFAFAVVFAVVAFYTVLHLVFFGFTGEPVGIDLGLAFVLPLVWAIGLLVSIRLRKSRTSALAWGYCTLAVLVVVLAFDTVRFGPIFSG